jgi:rhodanese-related sulfurtransferase
MKSLPFVLALSAICATSVVAQQAEPNKPDPNKPAAPATPAADNVKNVTPDEVEKLLGANKEIVVLDVRTPEEFEMGHISGARNISFLDPEFAKNVEAVSGKPIVLHCAAGPRSTRALEVLKTKSFPAIYHMNGGYKAWVAANKPTVGGVTAPK